MQRDPLGVNPIYYFNPISQFSDGLNVYEYVKSNPLYLKDPTGLMPELPPYVPSPGSYTWTVISPLGGICGKDVSEINAGLDKIISKSKGCPADWLIKTAAWFLQYKLKGTMIYKCEKPYKCGNKKKFDSEMTFYFNVTQSVDIAVSGPCTFTARVKLTMSRKGELGTCLCK